MKRICKQRLITKRRGPARECAGIWASSHGAVTPALQIREPCRADSIQEKELYGTEHQPRIAS